MDQTHFGVWEPSSFVIVDNVRSEQCLLRASDYDFRLTISCNMSFIGSPDSLEFN